MKVSAREIAEIVCLQLGRRQVAPQDRLMEDLGADSADLLNLVVALEDRWGIAIGEEEAGALRTVDDLRRLVESRD
ncbi:MAG: phosphopantetheine-binding protein [Acidobacteriota bacterium]|nr:phosphopantetheine-binding protein [Acidobacteriota bacterium]